MKTIGLTGGIGSGKSFVANEFTKFGIPVYQADIRAKIIMASHPAVKTELIKKLGNNAFINDTLNREFIAQQIFNDKTLIDWINSLVHPLVQHDFIDWKTAQHAPFVIKEAAILIESGAYKKCEKIIVVTAPEQLRIERVMERDGMTKQQVLARIQNQTNDSERLKHADYVINNDGTMLVSEQVEKIYREIKNIK